MVSGQKGVLEQLCGGGPLGGVFHEAAGNDPVERLAPEVEERGHTTMDGGVCSSVKAILIMLQKNSAL